MAHTHELLICRLRCRTCGSVADIGLPANGRIRDELSRTICPKCGRVGAMRLEPIPPPPTDSSRISGKYAEPFDVEGDDALLDRMKSCRRSN